MQFMRNHLVGALLLLAAVFVSVGMFAWAAGVPILSRSYDKSCSIYIQPLQLTGATASGCMLRFF